MLPGDTNMYIEDPFKDGADQFIYNEFGEIVSGAGMVAEALQGPDRVE